MMYHHKLPSHKLQTTKTDTNGDRTSPLILLHFRSRRKERKRERERVVLDLMKSLFINAEVLIRENQPLT